jgi:hypothetical protein
MPATAYSQSGLMSPRTLLRWYHGPHPRQHDHEHESDVWSTIGTAVGPTAADLRYHLDDAEGAELCAQVERLLLLVGTLCLQHDQPDLWRAIYAAALADVDPRHLEDPLSFVTARTTAARRGDL